jgi:hypothetical protein
MVLPGWGVYYRVGNNSPTGDMPRMSKRITDRDGVDSSIPTVGFNMKRVQKGHVTLKW